MRLYLLIPLLAAICCPVAWADGDPAAGKVKSTTCLGCHGIPGYNNVYPTYHVPRIGGQNFEYLLAALAGYRDGARSHPTMAQQADSLSDQDMKDIATYLSGLGKAE